MTRSEPIAQADDLRALNKAFAKLCAHLVGLDHERRNVPQLLIQGQRCVRGEGDINAPGLDANGAPKLGHFREVSDKSARHSSELSTSERRPLPHVNVRRSVSPPQVGSGIFLYTNRAPLQVGRFQLHIVRHSHKPCRTGTQARRLCDALGPLAGGQSPLRQINNTHFSASYSSAKIRRFENGLNPETKGNNP